MDNLLATFNYFDLGAIVLLIFLACRGAIRGMRKELAGVASTFGGLLGAWHFYPKVSDFIMENTRVDDTLAANAFAFVASMLLLSAGIRLLFIAFDKLMEYSFSNGVDRTGGFIAGFVQGCLTLGLVVIIAILLPSEFLKKHVIEDSHLGTWGEKHLPKYYNKLADESAFLPEIEQPDIEDVDEADEAEVVKPDPANEIPAEE